MYIINEYWLNRSFIDPVLILEIYPLIPEHWKNSLNSPSPSLLLLYVMYIWRNNCGADSMYLQCKFVENSSIYVPLLPSKAVWYGSTLVGLLWLYALAYLRFICLKAYCSPNFIKNFFCWWDFICQMRISRWNRKAVTRIF